MRVEVWSGGEATDGLSLKSKIAKAFLVSLLLAPAWRSPVACRGQTIGPPLLLLSAMSRTTSGAVQDDKGKSNRKNNGDKRAKVGSGCRGSDAQEKVILSTELVDVPVAVRDSKGRYVSGLTKEQFRIYDDEVSQQIAFFSDEDLPVTLGVVYDVSGSMRERKTQALQGLKRFLELSNPKDEFFLVTFSDRATLAQDFTSSVGAVLSHLTTIQPEGYTALYDAVYFGAEKLRHGLRAKKALLIISDGEENSSNHTERQLRDLTLESDGMIYAIGVGSRDYEAVLAGTVDPTTNMPIGFGPELLKNIATVTGGRAVFPDFCSSSDVMDACTQVALDLRHQYVIGYYPTDKSRPGRQHKIKITFTRPKGMGRVSLSYRRGYESPR